MRLRKLVFSRAATIPELAFDCRIRSVEDAVRMAEEHRRQKIAGATGFVLSRSSVFIAFGGPQGHGDSVEDAVYEVHMIAGATGSDVKLRAERKLGGRAKALAPHRHRVFIRSGGPLRALEHSVEDAVRKNTGDKIAGATDTLESGTPGMAGLRRQAFFS